MRHTTVGVPYKGAIGGKVSRILYIAAAQKKISGDGDVHH